VSLFRLIARRVRTLMASLAREIDRLLAFSRSNAKPVRVRTPGVLPDEIVSLEDQGIESVGNLMECSLRSFFKSRRPVPVALFPRCSMKALHPNVANNEPQGRASGSKAAFACANF
jgi:hypothetical protein